MKGKKILFIGGNRGMGLAAARIAKARGAEVIIASRNESKLKHTVEKELDGKASYHIVDATDPSSVKETLSKCKPVTDIVVTATGNKVPATSILKTPVGAAKKGFDGLWIAYNVVNLAGPYMERNGSITLISGSSAKTPGEGWGFWGIMQSSINSLVKFGCLEVAPIRLNAISPGGNRSRKTRQTAYGTYRYAGRCRANDCSRNQQSRYHRLDY